MLSFINMDIIGETEAFASCAIFRQKSEVWHTVFFTGIFCPLLVFTVLVVYCMQNYIKCKDSAVFKTAEKDSKC